MLSRLFPKQIDNDYRGHVVAIWLLVPLVLIKLLQGGSVAGFNPWATSRFILETADGVPIDTYDVGAASHLVFLFAAWGLNIFLFGILSAIALIRYRAMIPLIYLLMLAEQIGRKWQSMTHLGVPLIPAGLSASALINTAFTAVMVIGLALSLAPSRRKS